MADAGMRLVEDLLQLFARQRADPLRFGGLLVAETYGPQQLQKRMGLPNGFPFLAASRPGVGVARATASAFPSFQRASVRL